jgi:hypothetical protein
VVNKKAAHTVETTIDGNGFGYGEPAHIILERPRAEDAYSMPEGAGNRWEKLAVKRLISYETQGFQFVVAQPLRLSL